VLVLLDTVSNATADAMSQTKTNNGEASKWGRLASGDEEHHERRLAADDPGTYHGDIAASELHWFDAGHGAWLNRDPVSGAWRGYDAATGDNLDGPGVDTDWRPWQEGTTTASRVVRRGDRFWGNWIALG